MRVDRRLGDFIALLDDDHRLCLVAETFLEALDVVLAEVVVLIEHRHLGVRLLLQQILGIDPRLVLVVGLPSHGPGEVLRIVPLRRAGGDEQLRDLLGVQILLDCRVGRRAQRIEHQQHLVALDQLAGVLNRFGRAVGVVVGDEVHLAPVDAALLVDHLEVGRFGLADDAVGGGGTTIRHDVADLDLRVARARVVFLLGESAATGCGKGHDRR